MTGGIISIALLFEPSTLANYGDLAYCAWWNKLACIYCAQWMPYLIIQRDLLSCIHQDISLSRHKRSGKEYVS
jgi:hypothetical protein